MNDNVLIAEVEGYAAVFRDRDLNGDVIAPGAFARTLKTQNPVRMLYQHAAEAPIGRWTHLAEDARGLYARGEILLDSSRARDVAALIDGGALDGLSIGYRTVRAEKGRAGMRRILEADLWEVSVVTFPMAEGARIARIGQPALRQCSPRQHGSQDSRRASPLAPPAGRAPHLPHAAPWGARHFAETLRGAAKTISTQSRFISLRS